jgi:hypothetical protein
MNKSYESMSFKEIMDVVVSVEKSPDYMNSTVLGYENQKYHNYNHFLNKTRIDEKEMAKIRQYVV